MAEKRYYYINSQLEIDNSKDVGDKFDKEQFSCGNYFKEKEVAESVLEEFKKILEKYKNVIVFREAKEGKTIYINKNEIESLVYRKDLREYYLKTSCYHAYEISKEEYVRLMNKFENKEEENNE